MKREYIKERQLRNNRCAQTDSVHASTVNGYYTCLPGLWYNSCSLWFGWIDLIVSCAGTWAAGCGCFDSSTVWSQYKMLYTYYGFNYKLNMQSICFQVLTILHRKYITF